MDVCAARAKKIDEQLKKHRNIIKALNAEKKKALDRLVLLMKRYGYTECQGYRLEKLEAKPKAKRMTKKQKEARLKDALEKRGIWDADVLIAEVENKDI